MLIASSISNSAQNTEYFPLTDTEASEYNNDYKAFKSAYIKKLDSELHYKILILSKEFIDKLNHSENLKALSYIKDPLKYIKENFSTTSFESYETAVAEWEALGELQVKEWQENSSYYKLQLAILQKWGTKMLVDVTTEVKLEFPEKFNLLDNN